MSSRLQAHLVLAVTRHLNGEKPRVAEAGWLLWRIFTDLNRTRSYGGVGPNPIGFAEIEAYARHYRWPLETRHIEAISAMDHAWLEHAWAKIGAANGQLDQAARITGQEPIMTAALFDAVLG